MSPRARRRVDLYIDKLVLAGLPPAARERVGAALAAELHRLIDTHGLPRALAEAGRVLRLPDGSYAVGPGARGGRIGTQAAAALHRDLAGGNDPGARGAKR
jgi:hypothetical protein